MTTMDWNNILGLFCIVGIVVIVAHCWRIVCTEISEEESPDSEEVVISPYCLRTMMRGLMEVSRALCFESLTNALRPSDQSLVVSCNLNHLNYSRAAPADTIIKSVSESPITMFSPVKNSGNIRWFRISVMSISEPDSTFFSKFPIFSYNLKT